MGDMIPQGRMIKLILFEIDYLISLRRSSMTDYRTVYNIWKCVLCTLGATMAYVGQV